MPWFAGYAVRLAPGSIIAVSVPRIDDPGAFARVRDLWPGEFHNHTRTEAPGPADLGAQVGGLQGVNQGCDLRRYHFTKI